VDRGSENLFIVMIKGNDNRVGFNKYLSMSLEQNIKHYRSLPGFNMRTVYWNTVQTMEIERLYQIYDLFDHNPATLFEKIGRYC
jgi:hypothetical protein